MRKIPKGQQLETCVCDGTERPICEFVKGSMKALCFDAPDRDDGSGSDYDDDPDDDDDPDPDYPEDRNSGALQSGAICVLALSASILLLFRG